MNWLDPESHEQAKWLRKYARNHEWIYDYTDKDQLSSTKFCQCFIDEWRKEELTGDIKYKINLLRSAWNSHSKKANNVTFSLSPNAQKSLNYLSKRLKTSKTKIVNNLLIEAVTLIKKNKDKKFEAALLVPSFEREQGEFDKDSLLEELLSLEGMRIEISSLKEKQEVLNNTELQDDGK
jgi:hypothetical protein